MNQYLLDTQFATSELIKIIIFEENEMRNLKSKYKEKKSQHDLLYRDFIRKELDPDENFTEGQMMQSFYMQSKYYLEILQPIIEEIKILERSINIKDGSIRALSGALLQIAKQGISVVYRGLSGCPDGRIIKNESLKNIIWQARNQSIHYEESKFSPAVVSCFNNLQFASLSNINMAKDIFNLIGWNDYCDYEDDMVSLLG